MELMNNIILCDCCGKDLDESEKTISVNIDYLACSLECAVKLVNYELEHSEEDEVI